MVNTYQRYRAHNYCIISKLASIAIFRIEHDADTQYKETLPRSCHQMQLELRHTPASTWLHSDR